MPMINESRSVSRVRTKRRRTSYSSRVGQLVCLLLAVGLSSTDALPGDARRHFTVADDIGLSHFGDPYMKDVEPITFSPDGEYFVVDAERGRIDLDRPESTLRVYRTRDVEQFLRSRESEKQPLPLWTFEKASYRNGPIITNIRWLADSSGFAFLAKTAEGNDQLFLADLGTKKIFALTRTDQQVTSFDIHDRNHYVYCIQSPAVREMAAREQQATAVAAKGHTIYSLLFSGDDDLHFAAFKGNDLSELWAVIDGKPFQVRDGAGKPIPIRPDGQQALALSPDGRSVVTALGVRDVPPEWEREYPSALPSGAYRIRAGHQDPAALDQSVSVSEYVRIHLSDGQVTQLTKTPIGSVAGWWAFLKTTWSYDGKFVMLPDTFMPLDQENQNSQAGPPCTVVVELESGRINCVERFRAESTAGQDEDTFRLLAGVNFVAGTSARIELHYMRANGLDEIDRFSREPGGSWSIETGTTPDHEPARRKIDVAVKQDMNAPPVLIGTDRSTGVSKVIWDPNPQLKQIALGEESVFRWKDATGRDWIGGLYKPYNYIQGKRYPLVIQTHGFRQNSFDPAGVFPSAFAAQELAAAEIVALQVEDCPIRLSEDEASCQVAGYEAAVKQLSDAGVIDPDRVGIIGFSRTCYYVMQALTDSNLHLRAASITDGIVLGYVEYIMHWNLWNNESAHEADTMIGAPPFGKGLEQWLKHSPEFNLDKVTAPLQVVAIGRQAALTMWEPYAGLSFLSKPADMIVFPGGGTHVLTNPAQRLASQTGTVDWFRFWLRDEVDPDPQKREQYDRWRGLKDLESANPGGANGESTRGGTK